MKRLFFLLLVCMLFLACDRYQTVTVTLPDGFEVQARVADTPERRATGLMFVKSLPENQGMLFPFEEEGEQLFWMKNTLIDLDIVFIGADKQVTAVSEQMPHSYTYTPDHEVARTAGQGKYVLELAAKTAQRHGVIPGEKISFAL